MDGYEATRIVFSRIQNLEPENASKIMGLLLIQDNGEKEMIRLAFGPEALIHSVILKARKELGLNFSINPSSPSPLLSSNPVTISRQNFSSSSLGFNVPPSLAIPNPSSNICSSWSAVSDLPNPDDFISPSGSSLNPASAPFYANGGSDLKDDFQLQDQVSSLNDNSPDLCPKRPYLIYHKLDSLSSPTAAGTESMLLPSYWGGQIHHGSCSVSDTLSSEDPTTGFGWRPCLYFAKGYCKNGSDCRFVHGGIGEVDGTTVIGSPNKIEMVEQRNEMLRSKSAQQQRLGGTSQLMGTASFPYLPKSVNLPFQLQQNDSHRAAAAALMVADDMYKFGRSPLDSNDLINPASRQIYLTFPADSIFREEDVSNYFSIYGPVQDVRIPYQQNRMFGFVTFVYSETVQIILAKGNPHFVCDARVLVKPYKEKCKVSDKKQQQQQVEKGEFSPCSIPTRLDSRDPFDHQLGAKMFYNPQELLWKRKLEEQADLQQVLELQGRRLTGLQLLDVKKHHHQRAFSTGSPIPSSMHGSHLFNQSIAFSPIHNSTDISEDNCCTTMPTISMMDPPQKQTLGKGLIVSEENGSGKGSSGNEANDHLRESVEHNLPDSPFASPIKRCGEDFSAFVSGVCEAEKDATLPTPSSANSSSVRSSTFVPTNSSLDMGSFQSFNCQLPRFSPGHGTIAGTGGPTCPVGI